MILEIILAHFFLPPLPQVGLNIVKIIIAFLKNEHSPDSCDATWSMFSSNCYLLSSDIQSHDAASSRCSEIGASLFAATSSSEQDFVIRLLEADTVANDITGEEAWWYQQLWLDCTDSATEGTWLCGSDNHPIDYTSIVISILDFITIIHDGLRGLHHIFFIYLFHLYTG